MQFEYVIIILVVLIAGFGFIGLMVYFVLNNFANSLNNKVDKILTTTDELNQTLRKIQEIMETTKPVIYNFQEVMANVKKITSEVHQITTDVSFVTSKGRKSIEFIEKAGNAGIQKLIQYFQKSLKSKNKEV